MHSHFILLISSILLRHTLCVHANGIAFKTGNWTNEEEQTVVALYRDQLVSSKNSRVEWTKISRVIGRSPGHIRMHFSTKRHELIHSLQNASTTRGNHIWTEEDTAILNSTIQESVALKKLTDWDALAAKLDRSRSAVYMRYREVVLGLRSKADRQFGMKRTNGRLWAQRNKGAGDIVFYRTWTAQEDSAIMEVVDEALRLRVKPSFVSLAKTLQRSLSSVYGRYRRNLSAKGEVSDESSETSDTEEASDAFPEQDFDDESWQTDETGLVVDDTTALLRVSDDAIVNLSSHKLYTAVSNDEMDTLSGMSDIVDSGDVYDEVDLEDYGLKMPFEADDYKIDDNADYDLDLEYIN